MLKFLVGAAALAIIVFVGFYFYRTLSNEPGEKQKAVDALQRQTSGECLQVSLDLWTPRKSSAALPGDAAHTRNGFLWSCVRSGMVMPEELRHLPVGFLVAGDAGPSRLATNSGCVHLVAELMRQVPAPSAIERADIDVQVRGCLADELISVAELRALAGPSLDELIGLPADAN